MGIERAEAIAIMRRDFRGGLSGAASFRKLKAKGLSYRHQTMQADWRSVGQLETKKDLFKYVRRDYYPTAKIVAQVEWNLSKEFMYVMNVKKRTSPDAPITERRVNITSDVPMTPRMVEQAVIEKWAEWEKYQPEIIEAIVPFIAVHRSALWQV